MPFQQTKPLALAQRDDETWVLLEPLVYQGSRESFIVPAGTVTDFASVPRVATWLIPRFGRYTLAAVLHDWLCVQLALEHGSHVLAQRMRDTGRYIEADLQALHNARPAPATSRETDGLFRRVMRELGVPPVRRWLMWTGVRWGAALNPARRDGWWRDLPRMVPLTLLAVLVAGVPAAAILLGQLVYGAIELVTTALSREKTTTGVDATT